MILSNVLPPPLAPPRPPLPLPLPEKDVYKVKFYNKLIHKNKNKKTFF